MKSSFKRAFMLCALVLTSSLLFSQVKSNHSLTKSTKEIEMDNQTEFRNKESVRKLYEEILNTGRLELLNQVISGEFLGPQGKKGATGFAEIIRTLRDAFPDIKWTIEDLIAEENKVMVRWTWKGTNTRSFDGFPATNMEVIHNAISIFQFDDSKIIRAWMQADRLGFYQQIGVISADAITPPAKK